MKPNALSPSRYDAPTVWLHWLTVAVILLLWTLGQTIDLFPRGALRVDARSTHILLGLCLAVILVVRMIWRIGMGVRLPPADKGLWQIAAKSVHYLLYALMAGGVAAGIGLALVRGDNFFGWATLPNIAPGAKDLRDKLQDLHGTIANVILIVAGLHAAAGLFHHYVLRDDVLRRMLPGRR